jgi:hypothetical protein
VVDFLALLVEDLVGEVVGFDLEEVAQLGMGDILEGIERPELRLRGSVELLLATLVITLGGDLHMDGALIVEEGELGNEVLNDV